MPEFHVVAREKGSPREGRSELGNENAREEDIA